MIAVICFAAALGLVALCLRTWTEFGQRTRQLKGEIDHTTRLIADHMEQMKSVRSKIDETKGQMQSLLEERGKLESDVVHRRGEVTELEARLERTRPSTHRVDKDDKDDLF